MPPVAKPAHRFVPHAESKDPTSWDGTADTGGAADATAEPIHGVGVVHLVHQHGARQNAKTALARSPGSSPSQDAPVALPWSRGVRAMTRAG